MKVYLYLRRLVAGLKCQHPYRVEGDAIARGREMGSGWAGRWGRDGDGDGDEEGERDDDGDGDGNDDGKGDGDRDGQEDWSEEPLLHASRGRVN